MPRVSTHPGGFQVPARPAEARKQRARAIDCFAGQLRDLRASVGSPSFREMSRRSGAISYTTLHDAVQGIRLPSWGTTAEFVKACGADPAAYRSQWEAANRDVRAATSQIVLDAGPPQLADDPPAEVFDATDVQHPEPAAEADVATPWWRRRYVIVGAAAVVLVAATVSTALLLTDSDGDAEPGGQTPVSTERALTSADCPVQQQNPPPAPPRHKGDRATFVADVTLTDCTRVDPGSTMKKVWRFKNRGTVPWRGYSLSRVDPHHRNQCQTIEDVQIPDTEPGAIVDIEVSVTTPREPTFCFVRFKMLDGSGKIAFPGGRPVNFQIIVD